jgi:uncharacterized protein (TIGR00730 family)
VNPPPPKPFGALSETATNEAHLLSGRDSRFQELLRVARISREFVRGFRALHFVPPCVTFFGSARFGESSPYYGPARDLAGRVARQGFTVITGGGPGLMEAASRGAKDVGGRTVGATIDIGREPPNRYADVIVPFHYFFARKVILVKYSYGYVHLPGGFGTLDELFEALTLMQTGRLQEFPTILFGREYWAELVDWIKSTLVAKGAIRPDDLDRLVLTDDPDEVVHSLARTATRLGLKLEPPRPQPVR